MNPALLIHMATANIKATVKGHEANSIWNFVLEIKRNLCLFCVLFFRPLISRNIWLKGPFCRSQSSERVTKEPQQAAYRITHKTIHQGQSILQSTLAYWILSGIDPGTNNDLNYHRVPVPSGDRHLGQWASPPPQTPTYLTSGGGGGGGGYPLSSSKYPTRRTMSADLMSSFTSNPSLLRFTNIFNMFSIISFFFTQFKKRPNNFIRWNIVRSMKY